jgi:hypothetical protein
MRKGLLIVFLLVIKSATAVTVPLSSKVIMEKMMLQIQSIKTLKYHVHSKERVDGKYFEVLAEAKLNIAPLKLYVKNPDKKLEVLYVDGTNDNDALVNPGKFPYLTLSLNPDNYLMRKNQHHTIRQLGFEYMATVLSKTFPTNPKEFEKQFINAGTVIWKGFTCYKIFCDNPDFKYVSYKVKKGETAKSIGSKFNCGEYRILEKNSSVSMNGVIDEGKIISIPNSYASKLLFFVDAVTYLPVAFYVYDNEGLYESYEFSNIEVNPTFKPNEFQRDFKDYHF